MEQFYFKQGCSIRFGSGPNESMFWILHPGFYNYLILIYAEYVHNLGVIDYVCFNFYWILLYFSYSPTIFLFSRGRPSPTSWRSFRPTVESSSTRVGAWGTASGALDATTPLLFYPLSHWFVSHLLLQITIYFNHDANHSNSKASNNYIFGIWH